MMQDEEAEYQHYDVEMDEEENSLEDYQGSPKSPETILFRLDVVDEICKVSLNSGTLPIFGGDDSKDLSEEIQHFESKDRDDLENGVYLVYADSENDTTASDVEEFNSMFNDNSSIPETIDLELDLAKLDSLVDSFNKNGRYLQCEICDLTFRTMEQINEHSHSHDSAKIVTCEVCKNIIQKDLYIIHLKLHKMSYNRRKKKINKKVKCAMCAKLVSKSYLKRHMEMHSPSKRYKQCTICDKFFSFNYLSDHIKLQHMDIQYKPTKDKSILKLKCPICSGCFKETTYENHVARHAISRKKLVCEECGKECSSPSSFATHILTHKEVYKYKCQFCPYHAKHLGLLKIHVRTHTKDYLYKCATCGSSFITKSNLSAHERTHSPRAKLSCSDCGKLFAQKRFLENHMVCVHQGIKAFSCDICGKSYARKSSMMTHKKRIHNVALISQIGRKPSYLLGAQENNVVEEV